MPDETTPVPPAAPDPPFLPLEPGDFVTVVGGHPQRGDLPAEPVGRITGKHTAVKVTGFNPDKTAVFTAPDGVMLTVSWPLLRIETANRPEELARWEPSKP